MKKEQKEKARELRKDGWSYKSICRFLKVAQSSVSEWCKDIILTGEQRQVLDDRKITNGKSVGNIYSQKCYKIRQKNFEEGRDLAQKYKDQPDFVAGCMLYSGEGAKSENNKIGMANTDIRIIKTHQKFMKKYFGIEDRDFAVCFNFFIDENIKQENVEKYWLDNLGLPKECLRKSAARAAKSIKNKYPNGVCYLSFYSTEIKMKLMGAIDELFRIVLP